MYIARELRNDLKNFSLFSSKALANEYKIDEHLQNSS